MKNCVMIIAFKNVGHRFNNAMSKTGLADCRSVDRSSRDDRLTDFDAAGDDFSVGSTVHNNVITIP